MLEYGASRLIPLESARCAKGDPDPSKLVKFKSDLQKPPPHRFVSSFYLTKISNKIL